MRAFGHAAREWAAATPVPWFFVVTHDRIDPGVDVTAILGRRGSREEIQVNNSHSDRIRTGSLYHIVDLSNIPGKDESDEWIPMEIKAQGNTITITVKGQEVVRWTQPADWQSNYDTASRKIAPGTIAFQSHDTYSVTAYSNIRIKLN